MMSEILQASKGSSTAAPSTTLALTDTHATVEGEEITEEAAQLDDTTEGPSTTAPQPHTEGEIPAQAVLISSYKVPETSTSRPDKGKKVLITQPVSQVAGASMEQTNIPYVIIGCLI